MNTNPIGRNAKIDFLRGVAILLVLILHYALAYGFRKSPLGDLIPTPWLKTLVFNGNYGVTIFFVISGFLITVHSINRWGELKNINLRSFYIYRMARILPSLLLAVSIIVAAGCFDLPYFNNTDDGKNFPASYFIVAAGSVLSFWHNALMASVGYFNYCLNVYWSLSVEEMFYLAFPLACLLLRKTSLIIALCMTAMIIGPIYRSQHTENEIYYMYGYLACFDAIAIGCLTAILASRLKVNGPANQALTLISGLALIAVYLQGIGGNEVFGFTLIALSTAGLLFAFSSQGNHGWMTGRLTAWVRSLGKYSYEIYLFHIIILAALRNVVTAEQVGYYFKLPLFIAFVALSAWIAILVSRYFSEPINRSLREYFVDRKSGRFVVSLMGNG
ncbi:acyltransferase family protein [Parachitinimonas caeni]|uniref:Acyltransferase n=1 Tax=Parachitinimonas caeni TaxID=3031301 RepID=A0ABT7E0J7_9NEIS|nr:acyltransferase [Parachitinimonas caeni]MDK2125835.1 acyltransferase [Parachitinimonas caeni]